MATLVRPQRSTRNILTRANQEVGGLSASNWQTKCKRWRSLIICCDIDTFRLDYVGTKAGIKGAGVSMGI